MLTLFTIPKPFNGHIALIQHNAIKSWTLLQPRPEIILFGDDEGTAEVAKEFGVRHVPEVARNEYGTPLLNDMFEKAQSLAKHDILCYVNADIILMNDFFNAVVKVSHWRSHFLIVGQRWDIEIREPLVFSQDWENKLRSHVIEKGQLHTPTGIDYFVFQRGMLDEVPPFAIGRTTWDNWLIYRVRSLNVPVIDATNVLMAVHQNHDYSHVQPEAGDAWEGREAKRNLELACGWEHVFTLDDTTHELTINGPRLALSRRHLKRRIETLPTLYPCLSPLSFLKKGLVKGLKIVRFLTFKKKYNSKEGHS
jgi:hypothetical protein